MSASVDLVVIEEPAIDPIRDLDLRLKEEVIEASWLGRIWRGVTAVGEERGRWAQTAVIVAALGGTLMLVFSVGTSAVGSYKMFEEACLALKQGHHFPSNIGHAGGWAAQVLLYPYIYFGELSAVTAQGDLQKTLQIYREVLVNQPPEEIARIARHHEEILSDLGPRCLIPKYTMRQTLIRRDLLIEKIDIGRLERIASIFEDIGAQLKAALGSRYFVRRNLVGWKCVGEENGRLTQSAAMITGLIIPLFLVLQSFFMFTGVIILSKDLITGREPLDPIGHLGEWSPDAVGLIYMAKQLNKWSLTSYGDLAITREILSRNIAPFREDEDRLLYPKLVKLANEELKRVASQCMFSSIPSSYLLN